MPKFVCKYEGLKYNGNVLRYNDIIVSETNPNRAYFSVYVPIVKDIKKQRKVKKYE